MVTLRSTLFALVLLLVSAGQGLSQWEITYGPTGGAFIRVSCFVKIGTNLFAGTEGDGVWISTDNSASAWSKASADLTGKSVTALLAVGTDLIAGTNSGVFISTSNGANWTAINNGLINTSVGSLVLIGTNLFAGTLGGGVFLSTNNGASWTQVNNGLPGNAVSPLTACSTNLFAEVLGQGLYVSTNNGTNWNLAGTGLTSSTITALTSSGPNIFAGTSGTGVYLSTDNGANWDLASTALPNSTELCFAVSGNGVFAGAYNNGVFLTTDNGANWNDANDGFGSSRTIRCLAVLGDDLFAGFYNGEVRRRPLSQMISSTVSNLPTPIGVGSAEVYEGSIYYFGGSTSWSGSKRYPTVYKYDGNVWQYFSSMPDIDVWGISSTIKGDSAFVYGGYANGNNKLRIFNFVNRTWQYATSSPNISSPYGHTIEYVNGFIYLFFNGYVYKYDIGNNSWTQATTLSQNGSWLFSTVYQDEVYLTGWALGRFYKYSPASDQWTQLADLPYFVAGGALRCVDDKIYYVGGTTGSGSGTLNNTLVYDIATNQWSNAGINISANRAYMADVYYKDNFYVIGGLGSDGNAVGDVEIIIAGTPTAVETGNNIVTNFKLLQNYPNPFNPSTTISFSVPNADFVNLKVFNALGQEVASLVKEEKPAGSYEVNFNAAQLSSGVYFYKLQSGSFVETKKMILIK